MKSRRWTKFCQPQRSEGVCRSRPRLHGSGRWMGVEGGELGGMMPFASISLKATSREAWGSFHWVFRAYTHYEAHAPGKTLPLWPPVRPTHPVQMCEATAWWGCLAARPAPRSTLGPPWEDLPCGLPCGKETAELHTGLWGLRALFFINKLFLRAVLGWQQNWAESTEFPIA